MHTQSMRWQVYRAVVDVAIHAVGIREWGGRDDTTRWGPIHSFDFRNFDFEAGFETPMCCIAYSTLSSSYSMSTLKTITTI